jgi:nifR3 family TIM-barrel protein
MCHYVPMIQFGFWQKLREKAQHEKRPLLVLAPMADVTDAAFRRMIAKYSRMGEKGGGPDVLWTEFVSADGLFLGGREHLERDLVFSRGERPIVAQFFSSRPEMMEKAAYLASEYGFDGIDINMGCPDKSIEKQGAGAAMIKNPAKALEVIEAAKRGALRYAEEHSSFRKKCTPLPVSVKTRIGFNKNELETWLPAILSTHPAVVTVHARTRKELSLVPARWEHVREAVIIRDKVQAHLAPQDRTLILGNGDAHSIEDAEGKAQFSGADGVMLGRAVFGNPWLFDRKAILRKWALPDSDSIKTQKNINERLKVMLEHTKLFDKLLGGEKSFALMKKHYKAYVTGWEGAKDLRTSLMEAKDVKEVSKIVKEYLKR